MQNLEKQGKYVHIMTLINFRQISTYFFKKFDKLYMNRFSLNEVSFTYNTQNELILNSFTSEISGGDKVLLRGINGSGKSTFIKFINRFEFTYSRSHLN